MGALMQALTIPGVPDWAVPAAIVHFTLFLVLIVPVWRALSRAGVPGVIALVLILPLLGPIIIAVLYAVKVLRVAAWSRLWAIFIFVPVLNILFLWTFAFSEWSEREQRRRQRASQIPEDERPRLGALPPRDDATAPPRGPAVEPAPARRAAADNPDELTLMPAAGSPRDVTADPVKPPRERVSRPDGDTGPPAKAPRAKPAPPPAPPPSLDKDEKTMQVGADAAKADGGPVLWRLKGSSPRSAELSLTIDEDDLSRREAGLVVGRSTRVDFTITDESVSRNHARFVFRDGTLCVEDMESMNGTKLDGKLLDPGTPVPVGPGAIVEFGKIKLTATKA